MREECYKHERLYSQLHHGYVVQIMHDPDIFCGNPNYILVMEDNAYIVIGEFPATMQGWDNALSLCEVLSENKCLTRMWPACLARS